LLCVRVKSSGRANDWGDVTKRLKDEKKGPVSLGPYRRHFMHSPEIRGDDTDT